MLRVAYLHEIGFAYGLLIVINFSCVHWTLMLVIHCSVVSEVQSSRNSHMVLLSSL